jgi:hypothetical protein
MSCLSPTADSRPIVTPDPDHGGPSAWLSHPAQRLPRGNSRRAIGPAHDLETTGRAPMSRDHSASHQGGRQGILGEGVEKRDQGEPLAAIDRSRSGSTGSAIMAHFPAAADSGEPSVGLHVPGT